MVAGLDGFDFVDQRMKTIRRRTTGARPVPRVAGPVRRRGPIVVDDFRFARAHTDRPIKMAVPGPLTVIDSTYDDHYGDERALAMDIAAALNQELLELQAAGCDVVQIDEPAMTRYHEKTAEFAARALDRCLEGVTIPSIVHLCYGYPGGEEALQHEYQYPELLNVLMTTRIGGFSVEFARSGYDPAILRACKDRLVMFGCVDPGPVEESLGTVVGRVRSVLSHVDPGHLVLAPDCGLMTLSRDAARRKAGLLVAAAEMVRKEL